MYLIKIKHNGWIIPFYTMYKFILRIFKENIFIDFIENNLLF